MCSLHYLAVEFPIFSSIVDLCRLQETLERARRDTQLCNASVAHTFGVLKDALNGQGRLTRPAVHRCVRQLRETVRKKDRRVETKSLVDGTPVAGEPNHTSAAAEDVLDRLFDAFDVHNEGDVDFFEFASGLSVSWRDDKTFALNLTRGCSVFECKMHEPVVPTTHTP